MSFQVDPAALRRYAGRLDEVERIAEDAGRYVEAHGNFGFHEAGIIGFAAPGHRHLMANLHELVTRLRELGVESQKALRTAADEYQRTDEQAAAKVDATYPEVPRASPRD
jgi:hypothetical protein